MFKNFIFYIQIIHLYSFYFNYFLLNKVKIPYAKHEIRKRFVYSILLLSPNSFKNGHIHTNSLKGELNMSISLVKYLHDFDTNKALLNFYFFLSFFFFLSFLFFLSFFPFFFDFFSFFSSFSSSPSAFRIQSPSIFSLFSGCPSVCVPYST